MGQLVSAGEGRVSFDSHNVFLFTGEDVVVRSVLRFRTLEEMRRSLARSGFHVEQVYGDWDKRPVGVGTRLMIFVARRIV